MTAGAVSGRDSVEPSEDALPGASGAAASQSDIGESASFPSLSLWLTASGIALLGALTAARFLRSAPAEEILDLFTLLAALLTNAPWVLDACRPDGARDPERFTFQLLAISVAAAIATGEYGTAALLPVILSAGHVLETQALRRATLPGAFRQVDCLTATRLCDGRERAVAASEIRSGDILIVRKDGVLLADGVVETGTGTLDESSMKGEPLPRDVASGEWVLAGTRLLAGQLRFRAVDVGDQSAVGQLRAAWTNAMVAKTPLVRVVERWAAVYLPAVLLAALAALVVTGQVVRAISMVIVACPCAMLLSGPAARLLTLRRFQRLGALCRDGRALDGLAEADTIFFDKTGTLTQGCLVVTELAGAIPDDITAFHEALIAVARCSDHPVYRALAAFARSNSDSPAEAVDWFEETPGLGARFALRGRRWQLGRADWLFENGIELPAPPLHTGPIVAVAVEGRFQAYILLADPPREGLCGLMSELRGLALNLEVITGDRRASAEAVLGTLQLDAVHTDALPRDKLALVDAAKQHGRRVVFVGDGLNDALAMAGADVGIALATHHRTHAAETADVVLLDKDVRVVPQLLRIARRAQLITLQNLVLGMSVSVAMVAWAATGRVTPLYGALLHNLGALVVVINSLRLLVGTPRRDGADNNFSQRFPCTSKAGGEPVPLCFPGR